MNRIGIKLKLQASFRMQPKIHFSSATVSSSLSLSQAISSRIRLGGPISVADYMRSCLQYPKLGYYSRENNTTKSEQSSSSSTSSSSSSSLSQSSEAPNIILGSRGDFITSPEISQLFGELVGVWLVATHQSLVESGALSEQSPIAIAEIGPGRGTLINDALRSISKFAKTRRVLKALHLIETSSVLRKEQAKTLHCAEIKASLDNQSLGSLQITADSELSQQVIGNLGYIPSLPVLWHSSLDSIPSTVNDIHSIINPTNPSNGDAVSTNSNQSTSNPVATFFVCHELFDALPVHQLVWKGDHETGMWIERLVDNVPRNEAKDEPPVVPDHADVSSTKESSAIASTSSSPSNSSSTSTSSSTSSSSSSLPIFRMVLSNSPTPASVAYTAHERAMGEVNSTDNRLVSKHSEGDVAEYSPESVKLAYSLALRIKKNSGAALIIDYGGNSPSGAWTLRGIRKHAFVNPLSSPGDTDLSCDVDFASLAFAVAGSGNEAKAVGPVTQGVFLQRMGIRERLERLLIACGESPEANGEKKRLVTEAQRLVDPNDMGSLYKVLAIVPKELTAPVGF